jgi:hypothetical protein
LTLLLLHSPSHAAVAKQFSWVQPEQQNLLQVPIKW